MKYEWVIGKYEGDKANKVVELANASVGYFLLEQGGRGGTKEAIVAFKRPIDGPTPEHLEVIDEPSKIRKYEKLECLRKGVHSSHKDDNNVVTKCKVCGLS